MKYIAIIIFLFNVASAQSLFGVVAGDGGLLQETRNFARATGITNRTTLNKVNTFVRNLKDSGWWNDVVSIHPYVGGTSQSVVFNLKDTATYKLQLINSPTVNDTGIVLNGSTQYARTANTEYYLSEILGNDSLTMIARVNLTTQPNTTNGAGYIVNSISADGNSGLFELLGTNNTTNVRQFYRTRTGATNLLWPTTSTFNLNSYNNIGGTYDGSTMRLYLNGTVDATTQAATGNLATTVFDNAYRYTAHGVRPASIRGGVNSYMTGTFAFALVSKRVFTGAQMSTINTWINNLKN